MSKLLGDALRISLESDEPVNYPTDAIVQALQTVIDDGTLVEEPSLPALVGDVNEAATAASAIDEIATQTEVFAAAPEGTDLAPALESMVFATNVLLKSQGVPVTQCTSFESSADARTSLSELATQLRGKSKVVRDFVKVSMEDGFDNIRGNIGKIENVVAQSDRAISAAIAKIKNNARSIDESPITFNNAGIYNFMHYNRQPVTSFGGVMERELQNLGKLMSAANRFSALYVQLSKEAGKMNGGAAGATRSFVQTLMSVSIKKELYLLDGLNFLGNGTTTIDEIDNIEDYHEFDDDEGNKVQETIYGSPHSILTLDYVTPYGDGSKAPAAERNKAKNGGTAKGAVIGTIAGGLFGGMVAGPVGAIVGVAAGAFTFGLVGRGSGAIEADSRYHGTDTQSVTSTKELITFMEDCLKLPKMVRPLYNSVMFVGIDNDAIAAQFNESVDVMSLNEAMVRTFAEIASLLLTKGSSAANSSMNVQKEHYKVVVKNQLDAILVAHTSICEAAAYHAYMLTKVSASVCEQILTKINVK